MTFVRRSAAALVAMVVAGVVMVLSASPVWAHIELADSDPQNVSTVDEPVERVRLTFTGEADPAIEEFAIEDPDGNAVPITSVEPEGDGTTLIVTPSRPLAGGSFTPRSCSVLAGSATSPGCTVAARLKAAGLPS